MTTKELTYNDLEWWEGRDYEMDYEQDGVGVYGCLSVYVNGIFYSTLFDGHLEGGTVEIDEVYDAEQG